MYACGSNSSHQLGLGSGINSNNEDAYYQVETPIKLAMLQNYIIVKVAANCHSAAITSNGELFLWGSGVFGEYRTP